MNAEHLIKLLDLQPHPEGGYYRETYRSRLSIPGESLGTTGARSAGTAIYFMLVPGNVSHFHRLVFDEMFHFHMGDPVRWVLLHPDGKLEERYLGSPGPKGQEPQLVIPAGCWFGGALAEGGSFCLMGTTMAPGFEFKDFELAKRADLLSRFPHAKKELLAPFLLDN